MRREAVMEPLTFKQWCELNGRRWTACANYEEFEINAKDYEMYREAIALLHPKEKDND